MLDELKRKVYRANMRLVEEGLVVLTWGNVSERDPETGFFVIKPSGVPYALLKPRDMVVVNMEGHKVEGECRPSSDTPTHLAIYRAFGNVGGAWCTLIQSRRSHGRRRGERFRATAQRMRTSSMALCRSRALSPRTR